MKKLFKLSGAVLAAGVLFGVGVRIGQWLLPAPDVRVSLCVPSPAGTGAVPESCLPLDSLMEAQSETEEPAAAPSSPIQRL